jgi:hypothetical protein
LPKNRRNPRAAVAGKLLGQFANPTLLDSGSARPQAERAGMALEFSTWRFSPLRQAKPDSERHHETRFDPAGGLPLS